MIGDWVLLEGEIKQVQELLYDSITFDCFPHDYDDVAPIPLTKQILSKHFPEYEEGYTIGWWAKGDGFMVEFQNDTINVEAKQIRYVHELQHALKLCRIEKEIIL